VALVLGPWIARLATQVSAERSERIRSEERAVVAAHLHDSVLQTLALIQRSSDVREMSTLARAQERELRVWLYGPRSHSEDELLSSSLEQLAGLVEQRHHVKVEVVVVGDRPVDDRSRALLGAVGEAVHNAARHSEAASVSVYVECTPEGCSAYVTDEGRGFDPDRVPADRRGITDSIVGRMERHGGTATITSEPGEGTEVHLYLPENGT
jgi:signal transduction histidine kinase